MYVAVYHQLRIFQDALHKMWSEYKSWKFTPEWDRVLNKHLRHLVEKMRYAVFSYSVIWKLHDEGWIRVQFFWVGALNSFLRPIPMCFTLLVFNLNLVSKGREEERPRDSENEVGPIFVRSAVKQMTGFEYESK